MDKAFIVCSEVIIFLERSSLLLLLFFFFTFSALDAHRRFAWIPYPLAREAKDANGPLAITGLRRCVGLSVDAVRVDAEGREGGESGKGGDERRSVIAEQSRSVA